MVRTIDERFASIRRWNSKTVTGDVKLKLYKGNIISAGATSPYSLYSEDFVTFEEDDVYNQADAAGFYQLCSVYLLKLMH